MHHPEPVSKLIKLMDVCSSSERVFDAAGKFAPITDLRLLADRIRHTIIRYEFELRTETRRIESDGVHLQPRNVESPVDRNQLAVTCRYKLQEMIEAYGTALGSYLPAHARAMLVRQSRQLQEFNEELSRVSQAA